MASKRLTALTQEGILETLDELQSKELVIEKQPKTRAISINQSGEQVQSMVKTIQFQSKLIYS